MPQRRSPRLPTWDYERGAATFATFCTRIRGNVLGVVREDEVILNRLGRLCSSALGSVPEHATATIDYSIVMPDHVHAILITQGECDVRAVVGGVKAQVSRNAGITGLWQRSFHDHVVRDDADLERIREYIATNPMRWWIARSEGGTGPAPTKPWPDDAATTTHMP